MTRETYDRVMAAPDPLDRMALGCEECDRYLTQRQLKENPGVVAEWEDLGDSGVLCPKCSFPDESRPMPGFRLANGRDPMAGRDYSEHGDLSQDEYEYLNGIGAYSNDPEAVGERLVVRDEA